MYLSAVGRVITDRIEYDKLPDGRWRATLAGRLKATAAARSQDEARRMVEADQGAQRAAWMGPAPKKPSAPPDVRAKGAGRKSSKVVRMRAR
jgi:hypothetical protein